MAIRIELTDIDRTVAMAAPSTPILKTKIKIGSKMVFNTAPVTIVVIAYLGLPSALIIEFKAVPIIMNGNPIAIIFPYCMAYSLKLSVQPNTFSNCGKKIKLAIYKIITYLPKLVSGNYKKRTIEE